LRAFLNWCVENEHLKDSPLKDERQPKNQKKQAAFLSVEDVKKLLRCISAHYEVTENACGQKPDDEWLTAMIRVGVSTGLRRSSLCCLRWVDVNLRERLLTVRSREGEETKSGHERQLPLRGDALDVLRQLDTQRSPEAPAGDYVFTDRGATPSSLTAPRSGSNSSFAKRSSPNTSGSHFTACGTPPDRGSLCAASRCASSKRSSGTAA
jgi:integrase